MKTARPIDPFAPPAKPADEVPTHETTSEDIRRAARPRIVDATKTAAVSAVGAFIEIATKAETLPDGSARLFQSFKPSLPTLTAPDLCLCGEEMPWHLFALADERFSTVCICRLEWQWTGTRTARLKRIGAENPVADVDEARQRQARLQQAQTACAVEIATIAAHLRAEEPALAERTTHFPWRPYIEDGLSAEEVASLSLDGAPDGDEPRPAQRGRRK